MNKEELFSMPLKTEEVTAFGQTFLIQEMSGIRFEQFVKLHDAQASDTARNAIVLMYSAVDEAGNLVFTHDDLAKLSKLPFNGLNKLASAAIKLSNLHGEEKN